MTTTQIKIDEETKIMLDALKDRAGSPAYSKIFLFCLRKTYEVFK